MNEALKFRAWDSTTKQMKFFTFDDVATGVMTFYGDEQTMLCSTLKDSCGHDIYQGDLVQFEWAGASQIQPVTFQDGIFYAGYQLYQVAFYAKVIGNIYENSETLQETPPAEEPPVDPAPEEPLT